MGQVEEVVTRGIAQRVVDGGGFIVGMLGHKTIAALHNGYLEAIDGIVAIVVGLPGGHGVENRAVFVLHVDLCTQHAVFRKRIAHVAP